jgi:hypothetical protein
MKFADGTLKELKEVANQDWNFRMVLKESNRQWGVDISKLNRSFRDGSIIEIDNRTRDYLLRVFNHVNKNIVLIPQDVRKSIAAYFDHFKLQIPYCNQSTRHW